MKLTPVDKEMFDALSKSQLGKNLADFLIRLEDDLCDSRTWTEKDTKESANMAAERVKQELRMRIRPERKPHAVTQESI